MEYNVFVINKTIKKKTPKNTIFASTEIATVHAAWEIDDREAEQKNTTFQCVVVLVCVCKDVKPKSKLL